jgi:TIR domain
VARRRATAGAYYLSRMPLTEIERKIAIAVVHQFLKDGKPTPHKLLVREFKEPKSLENLVRVCVLNQTGYREGYLPRVLAFHYCGDADALQKAKTAVTIVLHVLKNLFEASMDRENFTPSDVEQHAQKIYDMPPTIDTINLGLFLVPEFACVLSTCASTSDHAKLTSLNISDDIVTLSNIDEVWDEHVRKNSRYVEDGPAPIPNAFELETVVVKGSSSTIKTGAGTRLLVFISHSSKDADLARVVVDLLTAGLGLLADQIRCSSVDGHRLPIGVNTESKLREEVNAAPVVIGLVTPNSLSSHYVMFELGARWGAEMFIAPLLAGVKTNELSGPLSLLNALSASNEAQLHQLLDNVSTRLNLPLQNTASYLRHLLAVKTLVDSSFAPDLTGSRLKKKEGSPSIAGLDVELTPSTGQAEQIFLTVKNRGRKETFHAQCRVVACRNDPNPPRLMTVNLAWEYDIRHLSLARGESGNLLIACAGEDKVHGLEWLQVRGYMGNNGPKSTWTRGQNDKLPEYDLEITVLGNGSNLPFVEHFTLRAGASCALEMVKLGPGGITGKTGQKSEKRR